MDDLSHNTAFIRALDEEGNILIYSSYGYDKIVSNGQEVNENLDANYVGNTADGGLIAYYDNLPEVKEFDDYELILINQEQEQIDVAEFYNPDFHKLKHYNGIIILSTVYHDEIKVWPPKFSD